MLVSLIFPVFRPLIEINCRFHELAKLSTNHLSIISVVVVLDNCQEPSELCTVPHVYSFNVLVNSFNIGRGPSILKALQLVNAKYVSLFDDDDPILIDNLSAAISQIAAGGKDTNYIFQTTSSVTSSLNNRQSFPTYAHFRFLSSISGDHKEFFLFNPNASILRLAFARRIPTSLIIIAYSCPQRWKYVAIPIVEKRYFPGGMTLSLRSSFQHRFSVQRVVHVLYALRQILFHH
jgi:hypothetical protein